MKRLLSFTVASITLWLLLITSGISVGYKSAEAYYPTNTFAAFTPTGYATMTADIASASATLATNALSSPAAHIVVVQNTGSNAAYVKLGSSAITTTIAGGYPVLPLQTAVLTIRDATHIASITAAGSSVLAITTGY